MPSTETPTPLTDKIFAGALILSTGLQIAESLVPRVPLFPWLRLGMSWAILLPFLLSFGVRPAIALFLAHGISCIPIVDADMRPVGILSWRDILRTLPVG